MARIIVVDDSDFIKDSLCKILVDNGHTVVAKASNGDQAFTMYETSKPDLVTIDITMPVTDGISAIKNIIQHYPEARIVVISAVTRKELVFEALVSGAKQYVFKPFSSQNILDAVNKALA